MARRTNNIVIRRVNGLEIICFNFDAIYVVHDKGINLYHRWLISDKYFYKSKWKPFRLSLLDHKNIDMDYINKIAIIAEVNISRVAKLPDFDGKKVIIARENGRTRNVS